jgi:Sugar (and other) transporter
LVNLGTTGVLAAADCGGSADHKFGSRTTSEGPERVFSSISTANLTAALVATIAVFVLCCTNAVISFLFPLLNSTLGSAGTFALFVGVNVTSWVFVRRYVPETKGTTLEELEERFEAQETTRVPLAV